jgi:hypothetical protein
MDALNLVELPQIKEFTGMAVFQERLMQINAI